MKHIQGLFEILNEAASVLEKVHYQESEAFEKFGLRDYLVDELQGTAFMVKDAQQAQPKRVPLFDAEIDAIYDKVDWSIAGSTITFARAIEAAHGIKQGGQHEVA